MYSCHPGRAPYYFSAWHCEQKRSILYFNTLWKCFFLHHKNFRWFCTIVFRIHTLIMTTNQHHIFFGKTLFWSCFGQPFLHTVLDVRYRARHIFLNVHCMLFMLWLGGKGNWGNTLRASMLIQNFYIPLALPSWWAVFLLCAKPLSFSAVQDCLRGLDMYCAKWLNKTCYICIEVCDSHLV